jgi:hypothetical protein
VLAFGFSGVANGRILTLGMTLALCIALGNMFGHRVRVWLTEVSEHRVQLSVMLLCVGLALAGA